MQSADEIIGYYYAATQPRTAAQACEIACQGAHKAGKEWAQKYGESRFLALRAGYLRQIAEEYRLEVAPRIYAPTLSSGEIADTSAAGHKRVIEVLRSILVHIEASGDTALIMSDGFGIVNAIETERKLLARAEGV